MILKGYHGTSKSIAGIICQEQRFKESIGDKQWLGHGAYFFKDDAIQAFIWGKYHNSLAPNDVGVVKVDINANHTLNIDLTITEHRDMVNRIFKLLVDEGKNKSEKATIYTKIEELLNSKTPCDGYVLDSIYKLNPYDLAIGAYPIPKQSGLSCFRHKPMHIQICVKNETCICFETLEELSHDEYRRIREAVRRKN